MSEMSPTGPMSPKDMEVYREDFSQGSKIMQEASKEYYVTSEVHKKAQLKKSMSEALGAMNKILNNVLRAEAKKYEKKLSEDYNNFITDTTPENMRKLNKDIQDVEKKL